MTDPHYMVKHSPGKGSGVFALRPRAAGTCVMEDRAVMKIPMTSLQFGDEEIRSSFEALTAAQKAQFLALHEGHRSVNTRLARISNANAFGIHNDASYLYLDVSRINHSCCPNAAVGEIADAMQILAIRPIEKGEEIFISYHSMMTGMTRQQRQNYLHWSYGFNCDCAVCSRKGREGQLSDARRRIINALTASVQGYQPSDFSPYDGPTHKENIPRHSFLLAGVLEAEGLMDRSVARAYNNAATILIGLMYEHKDIYILPAALYVRQWMEKSIAVVCEVCGATSPELLEIALGNNAALKADASVCAVAGAVLDPAVCVT
ncbi:hypothetical protein LTR87_016937 [Friedmanniomyces endolithicus]|nr:hypothetical protein LTR87_016937 [Friedmanniomyces endolithicus]